ASSQRSAVTFNVPPELLRSPTTHVVYAASVNCPFAAGLTVGSGDGLGNPVIEGQVNIGGGINVLGNVNSNPIIKLIQGSQMWNNWSQLEPTSVTYLRPRQRICPVGTDCTGGANLVESLDAELKVYGNLTHRMVDLQNTSNLGQVGSSACYSAGCRASGLLGKGPLDGVYVADGCPLPCTSTAFRFGGGSTLPV